MRARWSTAALSIALAACTAGGPIHEPGSGSGSDGSPGACATFAAALDAAVAGAGVGDAQDTRLPGAPWLRIDRFGASFAGEVDEPPLAADWLERLRRLDVAARRAEVANLPDGHLAGLSGVGRGAASVQDGVPAAARDATEAAAMARIDHCGRAAVAALRADGAAFERLRAAARVPDDYVAWQRVLGLYPLTVLPFVAGVRSEEAAIAAAFASHAGDVGRRTRIVAPPATSPPGGAAGAPSTAPHGPPWPRDALGVPRLDDATRGALLAAHAPVFALAGDGDDNRFGRVTLDALARPGVDLRQPVVYGRIAFTRWRGAVAVQLVYTAWFPRRPPAWPGDLLAGHLDGVVLRFTLADDGSVAMLDGIHACGCWHLFVPVGAWRVLPAPRPAEEWAFVPARLQAIPAGHRVRLRLAADTHAMEGVDTVADDAANGASADARYVLRDDDTLRSLPLPDTGRRSLFDQRGRIPASARAERWLFWPMGIADAGTMRQWGRHATAFAGRRHFDAPDLLERRFAAEPAPLPPASR